MTENDNFREAKARKLQTGLGLIFLGLVCVVFGAVFLVVPIDDKFGTVSEGLLVGANESIARRSNQTTLVILSAKGEAERFEIKSSMDFDAVGKIRKLANENKGAPVQYSALDNRLYWVKFKNGDELVGLAHLRAQRSWTGSMLAGSGLLLFIFGIIRIRSFRKITN